MIDSTIVRAHHCAVGIKKGTQRTEGLGRSRGGFTTKALLSLSKGSTPPQPFQRCCASSKPWAAPPAVPHDHRPHHRAARRPRLRRRRDPRRDRAGRRPGRDPRQAGPPQSFAPRSGQIPPAKPHRRRSSPPDEHKASDRQEPRTNVSDVVARPIVQPRQSRVTARGRWRQPLRRLLELPGYCRPVVRR